MQVNKKYLSIKAHYFFRMGGVSPMIFLLPLILRQKGVTEQLIGLFWSVLPFVGLLCNLISGSLADKLRAHRTVLLAAILSLTAGLNSLYFVPPIPSATSSSQETLNFSRHKTDLDLSDDDEIFPLEATVLSNDIEADVSVFSYFGYFEFWIIAACLLFEQVGVGIVTTVSDVVCFKVLGSECGKYGQQRVWGTIGMGILALVIGYIVDWWSIGKPEVDYTPVYFICVTMMSIDLLVVARMNIPKASNQPTDDLVSIGSVIFSPSSLIFLVTSFFSGIALGTTWTFKLMLVEDVTLVWDPNFTNLKLLQGLMIMSEAFLGELPFFFLAGWIIKKLGNKTVFGLCLAAQACRCIGLYMVSNPWFFILVELLNGPAYGLFQTNMVAYANHIAPPDAQGTLQAIVKSCFTLGLCSGSLFGGNLFQKFGGAVMFGLVGLLTFGYMVLYTVIQVCIAKFSTEKERPSDIEGYVKPGQQVHKLVPNWSVQRMGASHSSLVAAV